MSEIGVKRRKLSNGVDTLVLENRSLSITVLPQVGGRIWQIKYKPFDACLLWNNPEIEPARHPSGTCYDDVWSGGWDELFPNDEVAMIAGRKLPDHGELWTGEWDVQVEEKVNSVRVCLRLIAPASCMEVEKTISLTAESSQIAFQHRFSNQGESTFPFLWKLHPAFAVTPDHRIDFPRMRVSLEPAFLGTLKEAEREFDWPFTRLGCNVVDLRQVRPVEERQLYLLYGHHLQDGWCAITNTATGLSCGLQFDPDVFRSCWLFATYGGWRNYNVAVLEPCTGYPLNFEQMVKAGRERVLAPGELLETQVRFMVQEGMSSVGSIDEQGRMLEESPAEPVL